MGVTINDVAKKARVSKTTVSRYMNGKYEFMSLETKDRIEQAIEELNYIPNNIARSLKSKDSKIIGCMLADLSNQFSNYIFKGINEACKENGYRLLVTEISNHEEGEIEAINTLLSYNIDGLIVNTTGSNDEYIMQLSKTVPIVLADRFIPDNKEIDTVTSNNEHSVFEMIKHLKDCNYDKVIFLSYQIENNSIRKLRINSFLSSMKEIFNLDSKTDIYYINENNQEELSGKIKIIKSKYKKERIAIFTVNGTLLLNLLQNLKKLKIDYEKEDIGICSFDDWGWAELVNNGGITTISQQSVECGKRCTKLLLNRIKNKSKKNEYIELKTKIKFRGSTRRKEQF